MLWQGLLKVFFVLFFLFSLNFPYQILPVSVCLVEAGVFFLEPSRWVKAFAHMIFF